MEGLIMQYSLLDSNGRIRIFDDCRDLSLVLFHPIKYPKRRDFWFFFTAKKNGYVVFLRCGKLFCVILWGKVGESVYFYVKIRLAV